MNGYRYSNLSLFVKLKCMWVNYTSTLLNSCADSHIIIVNISQCTCFVLITLSCGIGVNNDLLTSKHFINLGNRGFSISIMLDTVHEKDGGGGTNDSGKRHPSGKCHSGGELWRYVLL